MNRRNFINGLLTAAAGFSILPPATTYGRVWRAERLQFIKQVGGIEYWRYYSTKGGTITRISHAQFQEMESNKFAWCGPGPLCYLM